MTTKPVFELFSSTGSGFFDSPEPSLPPPPPPVEVLPFEVPSSAKVAMEEVSAGNRTLLKGRVSTKEVFGLPNSDLVPGVYEGGLKLWEGSIDLIEALQLEIKKGCLSFPGKRVLELGCGHGLPGIFAFIEGASLTHFQDFNAEVLRCLTIPNVKANFLKKYPIESGQEKSCHTGPYENVRYFAGDWSEVDQLLFPVHDSEKDLNPTTVAGYDIILMAETIYSISAQQHLYGLIKKCLSYPHGVVYMAAKKYYFGVGGGTRQFLSLIEKDGFLDASLVTEVTNGSSNVREVWKLSHRQGK